MSDFLYWLVIVCLVILLVSLTNILGLTATREVNRPKNYFRVIWCIFVVTILNLAVAIKSKDVGMELTPISFTFATITLLLTRVWFIVVKDVKMILLFQRLTWFKNESLKVVACLLIIVLLIFAGHTN